MMSASTAATETDRVSGEALLTSLRRPSVEESIAWDVRRHILDRGLRPGDRLPSEGDLATVLGSSRLSVREGLRALEALGLLEARVGSGWYLRQFDVSTAARTFAWSLAFHPSALLDLLAVRRACEADIVEQLAGRLAEADLIALDEVVDRMQWRASRGKWFVAEDREFHTRLFAASGNQISLALVDFYWDITEALIHHGFPGPSIDALPRIAELHAELLDTLRRGDPDEARRVLRASHHEEAESRLQRWLAGEGAEAKDSGASVVRAAVKDVLLGRSQRQARPRRVQTDTAEIGGHVTAGASA